MADNEYQFRSPATVKTTNRVNTGTRPQPGPWKGSVRIANIVAAGETLPVPCQGTQFYFRTLTAQIKCRPNRGAFSDFNQGEGLNLDEQDSFSLLEIKNEQTFPVVFEIHVGFQGFIDNKLILADTLYPNVVYPTYSTPSSAASVAINDLSGQAFTDINGNQWYALNRIAIIVCNTDTGVTLLLQRASSVVANGPAIAAIQPTFSLNYPASGNYKLHLGGANINAIVSEIYRAIPKNP